MMPAILVNENFPRPALRLLRNNGVTVEAVEELMPGATDLVVLEYACAKGMWLITFDRDYGEWCSQKSCRVLRRLFTSDRSHFHPRCQASW
jgi:predicted nuclease of predicted toxin-antitoxin system